MESPVLAGNGDRQEGQLGRGEDVLRLLVREHGVDRVVRDVRAPAEDGVRRGGQGGEGEEGESSGQGAWAPEGTPLLTGGEGVGVGHDPEPHEEHEGIDDEQTEQHVEADDLVGKRGAAPRAVPDGEHDRRHGEGGDGQAPGDSSRVDLPRPRQQQREQPAEKRSWHVPRDT